MCCKLESHQICQSVIGVHLCDEICQMHVTAAATCVCFQLVFSGGTETIPMLASCPQPPSMSVRFRPLQDDNQRTLHLCRRGLREFDPGDNSLDSAKLPSHRCEFFASLLRLNKMMECSECRGFQVGSTHMIAAGLLKAGAKQGAMLKKRAQSTARLFLVMDNDGKAMNCQQIKPDALALR